MDIKCIFPPPQAPIGLLHKHQDAHFTHVGSKGSVTLSLPHTHTRGESESNKLLLFFFYSFCVSHNKKQTRIYSTGEQ